jgi:hypothetical protein
VAVEERDACQAHQLGHRTLLRPLLWWRCLQRHAPVVMLQVRRPQRRVHVGHDRLRHVLHERGVQMQHVVMHVAHDHIHKLRPLSRRAVIFIRFQVLEPRIRRTLAPQASQLQLVVHFPPQFQRILQ